MRRGRPPHDDILTPREWEVLALLRDDLTYPQIALRLGISERGAKYHVLEIISKLGVSKRREASQWVTLISVLGIATGALGFLLFARFLKAWDLHQRRRSGSQAGEAPQSHVYLLAVCAVLLLATALVLLLLAANIAGRP
ncbi:MAG: hypothetical protein GEU75_11810 [Dehalococcoidia bacterium]|nr:hypothetical protein [Dehalococcoidia bacterium]